MKKNEKITKKAAAKNRPAGNKVEEPMPVYRSIKSLPQVKEFNYNEFKKVAEKTPFTQAEWAAMLHISERTLQRYAKNNGSFASINTERFHQINTILAKGKKLFGSMQAFYEWINANPPSLEGDLSFASLTSFDGLQKVGTQLGRIEHGILA